MIERSNESEPKAEREASPSFVCAGGAVNIIGEAGAHTTHFIIDKCIDQLVVMVLNGDIVEYENIGGLALNEAEHTAVDVIVAIANGINWWVPIRLLRLTGGAGELALRQINTPMELSSEVVAYGRQLAEQGVNWVGERLYNNTVDYFRNQKKRPRDEPPRKENKKRPIADALRGGGPGAAMLAWKNSLTKMYHTYHSYTMSPILKSLAINDASPVPVARYVHYCEEGNGPHLYWKFEVSFANGTKRYSQFNKLSYWDGGWEVPALEVPYSAGPPVTPYSPKKNFRTGASGTIYIFNADWPGCIMNHDPKTRAGTTGQDLLWTDMEYGGTVTTTNYPRKWTSVFANTNWQYLTIYGTQYRFDVTNFSCRDYCLEITLFKFKADIDAMDYEKQCLAAFGGYHTGTNAYVEQLAFMPIADVNIVSRKRYIINGMKLNGNVNDTFTEGTRKNNKTIKYNIKRRYVIKRPLLNSYETTLTENDIYNKYYEAQKGTYFRFMAWPQDIIAYTNNSTGLAGVYGEDTIVPSVPNVGNEGTPTKFASGLQVQMYKKSYFKLDENSATF